MYLYTYPSISQSIQANPNQPSPIQPNPILSNPIQSIYLFSLNGIKTNQEIKDIRQIKFDLIAANSSCHLGCVSISEQNKQANFTAVFLKKAQNQAQLGCQWGILSSS